MKTNSSSVKEQLKNVIDNLDENELLKVLKGLSTKVNLPFEYTDIKTFEDACEKLGIDSNSVYNDSDTKDEIAYMKLKIIYKAINNGWVPDFTNFNQYKYYPYFKVLSSGLAFSLTGCVFDRTITSVGVRLCTDTAAKAEYIGKQFKDFYEDYLL
jgi:PKD repeat protein